jgi:hypothetical protein
MGDSAHTTHHTNPEKKSAPPLFLEDENIFQKSATLVLSRIPAVRLVRYSGLILTAIWQWRENNMNS